jgi:hypothetical protein
MGIDDEEMPVTVDDRAINIIPMGDDDSVAGRMEPKAVFQIRCSSNHSRRHSRHSERVRETSGHSREELERKRMKSKQMPKDNSEAVRMK